MPIETAALTYIKMAQWVSLRCGKSKPPIAALIARLAICSAP
jgi:hypothetical protein